MKKRAHRLLLEQPPLHRRGFFARLAALGATAMLGSMAKAARKEERPMLNELKHEHFSRLVDQPFIIKHDRGTLVVTLIEAKRFGTGERAGLRDPYSLIFRSSERGHLPQHIYEVSHATLGDHELFLVPIGSDEQGMRYQAIFA